MQLAKVLMFFLVLIGISNREKVAIILDVLELSQIYILFFKAYIALDI